MLKWQSIGHFSALNFASTFKTKSHPNKHEQGLWHISVLLLRLSHRNKGTRSLNLSILRNFWQRRGNGKKKSLCHFKNEEIQSKINLAIPKFKSNNEFKMRAFSREHFTMNTNIIVSWSVNEIVSSVGG